MTTLDALKRLNEAAYDALKASKRDAAVPRDVLAQIASRTDALVDGYPAQQVAS
ncbi:hypothetical protein [Oceaniglobus trochenteri]|uniref:hypothetical protein n=1 Tax=Oceaniglobus trochenteri TaxID=2763260 RepID=UPI001CFF65D1|nr:hypothetical protein [Oceaniglobus trochenteri]